MLDNVMIDIETLGTKSNSIILSIAAVQFDIETAETGNEFYVNIDPESCARIGLGVDEGTVKWWKNQSKEAKDALLKDRQYLIVAFRYFINYLEDLEYPITELKLWGNSARFDLGLVENAMNAIGYSTPWKYWNERDVRTLVSFAPEIKKNFPRAGIAHNAIDDCKFQIAYCSAIWNKLKYPSHSTFNI